MRLFRSIALFAAFIFFTNGAYAAISGGVQYDNFLQNVEMSAIEPLEEENDSDFFEQYFSSKSDIHLWHGYKPHNMLSSLELYYFKKAAPKRKINSSLVSSPDTYNISLAGNSLSQVAERSWEELFTANQHRADFLYAYAMYLKTSSDYHGALVMLDRATKTDPDFALGYFLMGDIYRTLGEYKRAVLSYAITIKVNPYCTDAYFNIAKIFEEFDSLELALDFYRYAYITSPKDVEIRNSILRLERKVANAKELATASSQPVGLRPKSLAKL